MHQLVTKLPQPTCFLEEPSRVPSVEMVLSASPCTEHHPWSRSGLVPGSCPGSHRLVIILPLEMIWTSLYNMTLMPFISCSECNFSPGKAGLNFHNTIHLSCFSFPPIMTSQFNFAQTEAAITMRNMRWASSDNGGEGTSFPAPCPWQPPTPG